MSDLIKPLVLHSMQSISKHSQSKHNNSLHTLQEDSKPSFRGTKNSFLYDAGGNGNVQILALNVNASSP